MQQRNLSLVIDVNDECAVYDEATDSKVATFAKKEDAYLFIDATKSFPLAYSRKRKAETAAQYALDAKNLNRRQP